MEDRIDFTIVSKPAYIRLDCPHCGNDISIDFDDVDEPDGWQDDWGYVECPECHEMIKLGDWDYD